MDRAPAAGIPAQPAEPLHPPPEFRLSADHIRAEDRLDYWRHTITSQLIQAEIVHTETTVAKCEAVIRVAGGLPMLGGRNSPHAATRTARHVRLDGRDALMVSLLRSGTYLDEQDGRRLRREPGMLAFGDMARPSATTALAESETVNFAIPRERIEGVFGSAKRFTLLPIDAALGGAAISAFLIGLYDGIPAMAPDRAAELAEVGIELVLGALARRLALEPRLPQAAVLVLFRAKAYITAHLDEADLKPPQVAAALGISIRHLQELFRREQTSPSDWIWSRRLAQAHDRLSAPGYAGRSVGDIAFACGFSDPAHFSRRFKAAYGIGPRECRQQALTRLAGA